MPKKVVIIGPESTGKSTLCMKLARHYNTLWCPEYAREFLIKNGTAYTYDDLLTIAKGQIELENEFIKKLPDVDSLLFIDTDMIVMKVWCEFVFGKCHQFIYDQIAERKYDLYLLCNTDLPWVKDELREYPDPEKRQHLFNLYKNIMLDQKTPWVEIKGTDEERLLNAIAAIESFR